MIIVNIVSKNNESSSSSGDGIGDGDDGNDQRFFSIETVKPNNEWLCNGGCRTLCYVGHRTHSARMSDLKPAAGWLAAAVYRPFQRPVHNAYAIFCFVSTALFLFCMIWSTTATIGRLCTENA